MKVLRIIFGTTRKELAQGWIKLHSKELQGFLCFPRYYYSAQTNRINGRVGMHQSTENGYNLYTGQAEKEKLEYGHQK